MQAPAQIIDLTDPLRVGDSETDGSAQNLRPLSAAPVVVEVDYGNSLKLTGSPIPLVRHTRLAKRVKFYGIKAMNGNNQAPTPNDNIVYLGFGPNFQPIQIPAYNGYWGYELAALDPHVYDLSRIYVCGTAGDFLYFDIE